MSAPSARFRPSARRQYYSVLPTIFETEVPENRTRRLDSYTRAEATLLHKTGRRALATVSSEMSSSAVEERKSALEVFVRGIKDKAIENGDQAGKLLDAWEKGCLRIYCASTQTPWASKHIKEQLAPAKTATDKGEEVRLFSLLDFEGNQLTS